MKIKYRYFLLRFPNVLANFCEMIERNFNASYIDLPYMLPIDSTVCVYQGADIISYLGRKFYLANEKIDICFNVEKYLKVRTFGLINIYNCHPMDENGDCLHEKDLKYIFWSNFCDDKLIELLCAFTDESNIRLFVNPVRLTTSIICTNYQENFKI